MRSRHGDPLADPQRLVPRVYAYVAYIVGDETDAREITRAAIMRAVRRRRTYNPKRSSPLAWVFGMARHCIADYYREPFATTGDELDELPEIVPLPHTVGHDDIRGAVAQLGPRDRELIALRFGAGLNSREIGEQLDLSRHSVEAGLQHARARVRAILVDDADRLLTAD